MPGIRPVQVLILSPIMTLSGNKPLQSRESVCEAEMRESQYGFLQLDAATWLLIWGLYSG